MDRPVAHGSSTSERDAGWRCREEGGYRALLDQAESSIPPSTGEKSGGAARQFRWSLFTGRQARNEKLAKLHDPSSDQRRAWIEHIRPEAPASLTVRLESENGATSFAVIGDPGEGDASQLAVVEPLLRTCGDTDFMVIASDVVYPAGDVNDYRRKFYFPYAGFRRPVFAVPGNHDWDDGGLFGFMYHHCGQDVFPRGVLEAVPPWLRPFWKKPAPVEPATRAARDERRREVPQPLQPGSYCALDTGPVLVLCADLGLRGTVDRDQGAWLRRLASADERPKILVAGKPIFFDGKYDPAPVEGGGTIDEIVRDPANRFIAVITGEVHNYQRYPVAVEGDRTIQYVVCGGGGAFTQGTHTVGRIDIPNPNPSLPAVREEEVRLYPLRGDSLSFFSQLYAAKAGELAGGSARWRLLARLLRSRGLSSPAELWIRPDQAARIMADRIGVPPERSDVAEPTDLEQRAADVVRWLPSGHFTEIYYPYWDWDQPPFFKSFLRVDASADTVRIRCFAATGCAEHEAEPPLEDEVRWTSEAGWETR